MLCTLFSTTKGVLLMGYTHYFNTLVPDERLARITKEIVKESAVTICGGMGKGKPVITEREISLNGDESRREDYETFCIPNREEDLGFHNFCKTAHQPYDEVVTAILCAALYLNCKGSDSIRSDGDFKEWYESGGITLFQKAYEAVYRKKVDDERLIDLLEKQIGDRDWAW